MHFAEGAFLNAVSEGGLASIAHGGPPLNKSVEMPPYGATLTKAQIEALIDYTRAVAIRRTVRRV
jgi:mono/diheme cytochrome c family protein